MKRKRHSAKDRGWDFYQTPPVATRALLTVEQLPHGVWEPHCGLGAIAEVLLDAGHAVFCSDAKDRGYPMQSWTRDFLTTTFAPLGVDAIVMNPPYADAALHIWHGLTLVPVVIALLPLAFLEAGVPHTELGRARIRVLDTGVLVRVHIFRNRLPMMHREGWKGKISTSNTPYAWFVFDADHKGPATVDRISWIDESVRTGR